MIRLYRKIKIYFKSLYFNYQYFNFKDAIKLPILINHNVVFKKLKGSIKIESQLYKGVIKIGFPYVGIVNEKYSVSVLEINGDIVFKGNALIGSGSKISVGENGLLIFGDNFVLTAESKIICFKNIIFGDDCLLSWDILIMDTDFHKISYNSGEFKECEGKISIGNRNWIGCNTIILKGTVTGNNVVISSFSKLYKDYNASNILISGNPGKIIKDIVEWKE